MVGISFTEYETSYLMSINVSLLGENFSIEYDLSDFVMDL